MWFNVFVKSINPERSMVAARKPWGVPGLKQHQMENHPGSFQAKNPEHSMVAARKPWMPLASNCFKNLVNPERSMVAARKPWDAPININPI